MLAGFHAMDEHFRTAPFEQNLPVLMGLLAVWYNNFFGAQTVAVLPYDQYLKRFPAYLQQLTMESNGKHVTLDGAPVGCQTGPIFWGEPGTNGQHSFYQLIHQGTKLIPCDFIAFCRRSTRFGPSRPADRQRLRAGRGAGVRQDRGGGDAPRARPTGSCRTGRSRATVRRTVILAERLTPSVLGTLVALYEHSVFTQGVVWGIDSFDQWGVELGQGAGEAHHSRAASGRRARALASRRLDASADPALPSYAEQG